MNISELTLLESNRQRFGDNSDETAFRIVCLERLVYSPEMSTVYADVPSALFSIALYEHYYSEYVTRFLTVSSTAVRVYVRRRWFALAFVCGEVGSIRRTYLPSGTYCGNINI